MDYKEAARSHEHNKKQGSISSLINKSTINSFEAGYEFCKKEYEEKIRWIPIFEQLPKTAELVIVDSGNDLHACVAVAFYENEEWKYANGIKLWFRPTQWRYFYNAT